MQPIGPLMHEHRLIERMVGLVAEQAEAIKRGIAPDSEFIEDAVEFFRVYADRCHHGKEEELLFKELGSKDLTPELSAIMQELIEEHKQGRSLVASLYQANKKYRKEGGDSQSVVELLNELSSFYPAHIEKEDKHFFFPVMEYFTREQMDSMLEDFNTFDRQMIHELFLQRVDNWEKVSEQSGSGNAG
ncbi:MAG: hemerythrin domain-containing protein [Deltaproteobacteria bacterium]|nr:hemerythrin domain-containing protein [Deltaproteobacteria bacterium]